MIKTFKYKLYPNKVQSQAMHQTTFLCSLVYNRCLAERKDAWELEKRSVTYNQQQNQLPTLKKEDERFKTVHSQVLQNAVRRVDGSFQNFFRRVKKGETPGYPRFKSARRYDSFTYPQGGFKLIEDGRKLRLSKIGDVKIKLHRPIEGEIKTLTIRRQVDGWFACFSCEVEPKRLSPNNKAVGVDLGIANFAITSDGEFFPPIKYLRKGERKIKRHQRIVSRRASCSRRRKKAVRNLARSHQRVRYKRADTHHKVARRLVNLYSLIVTEALVVSNMLKNHHLAKSISDAGWSSFSTVLFYKAEEAGREVAYVDPKFTSQMCSSCGAITKKSLSQRWHSCACGCELHRDVNAAKNILTQVATY
jgi:putative transposase